MPKPSLPWLSIGCLTLMLCGRGVSVYGEDAVFKSPAWSSLRQQSDSLASDHFPTLDPNRGVFRQAPSLSGRFEVNDQAFFPFVGAGFGGGYTNDRDRALGSNGLFHNPAQSGDLGRNMMPNEFNLGLRIPF